MLLFVFMGSLLWIGGPSRVYPASYDVEEKGPTSHNAKIMADVCFGLYRVLTSSSSIQSKLNFIFPS